MWLLRLLRRIAALENRILAKRLRGAARPQEEARLAELRAEAARLVAAQPELPLQPRLPASDQRGQLTEIHAARGTPRQAKLVQRFAQANLGLAYKYAERWRCVEIPLIDLRQEAVAWLLDAIHRWEPGHAGSFAGFALWRMRHGLTEYAKKKVPLIHLPGNVRRDQQKVAGALRTLQARLRRAPTADELEKATELSSHRIEVALAYAGGVPVSSFEDERQVA